jgi:ribosomal protein S1
MTVKKGVYEITNNEGAICYVDTATKGKNTYGPTWAAICESLKSHRVLEAVIDRYQYRSTNGKPEETRPTGFVVKINNEVEAFLPGSLSSCTNYNIVHVGERIAVMVVSFDPLSQSLVMREIRVADEGFDIDMVNEALDLVGKASAEDKYVRGTIVGEKVSRIHNRRSAYLLSIGGLEAFLPCNQTFFPYIDNVEKIIGHHVLASVLEISLEKLSVVMSMNTPYENMIAELPAPEIQQKTEGIVCWVTPYNVYILLPKQVLGIIPQKMYQNRDYSDWLNLTGTLVQCMPFRKKYWNTSTGDYQYYVTLYQ